MAHLPLLLWPNRKLKTVSAPLTFEETQTDDFKRTLDLIHQTLLHYRGVGLSAIQVDWPVRLFAMRTLKSVLTFINPEIVSTDGEEGVVEEGCLSIPGVYEWVKRYPNVVLVANDLETWERRTWDLEGIEAQCAQHEVEHLDGVMRISDNAGLAKRDIFRRKIARQLKFNPLFGGR